MTGVKPDVAIFIPGGIGTGKNNIGVPVLERVILLLSRDFRITVFQLYPVNDHYTAVGFELVSIYSSNPVVKSIKLLWIFWKTHRRRKFQAIHGFWAFPCGFLAVVAGKAFNIRSIISLQGGDAISLPEIRYGQLQKGYYRKLILWALHRAAVLISPTRYLIKNLEHAGMKRREDIRYIPLGIDTSMFAFREKPLGDPVKFLHIANFTPVKDQVTLLKAFQCISKKIHCQLTIVGEGSWKSRIKKFAEELEINTMVVFMDQVPYESLPLLYSEADILLHTSLSEGHPIVMEEAMSCGVLVCGTRVGLLYDLPDCCVAVPVREFAFLAEETLRLVDDPEKMRSQRARARKWIEEHSMDWTMERFKELYGAEHK